jgi:alkylation response protein AidB-like acyl-CoA dehydrogenase
MFTLTDEQELLRDTVRRFVAEVCPPAQAKAWDETGTYPAELFSRMADLGWFTLPFAESDGGAGAGPVELAILAEELGHASFDITMCYISTLVAGLALARWASPEQRAELLPGLFSGRSRLALSMSEPGAGSDVSALRTRARRVGNSWIVNGQKTWCTGAALPNTLITMYVRTGDGATGRDGISLMLIDPESVGVELRKIPTLARGILGTYEVTLEDVQVPADRLIGPLDHGWDVLLSGLELERVLISGGYVGAAQQTIDEAVIYAKQREQFGKPIGSFQALAHPLADLQTEVDAARLLAYRAAHLLAQGKPCGREGSMAKLFGSETYVKAARWGMQVWGGYGFSTDSIMSFRYRESIVATISGGTSQIQRNVIARSMGLRPT